MPEPGAERPATGFGGALSGLAATIVAMLRTRLELATVEFEEERERTKIMLLLVVIATVFSCFAVVALSVLVVALLWDEHSADTMGVAASLGCQVVGVHPGQDLSTALYNEVGAGVRH